MGFYRRMGFEKIPDRMSPHVLMWTDLEETTLKAWRGLLDLAPGVSKS